MKTYLLSIYQPDGPAPSPEMLDPVMRDIETLLADAKAANVWVFNGGLHAADAATVVRQERGELLVTDGPFAEGKEHVGGFLVVRVADLDAALAWAGRLARALTLQGQERGLSVEVRPFEHVGA